ncbi:two-component system QseEF-associated lipoprotein QseG [Acerihabitans arboris]|uniref:Two-component system QseEF-associated lipoprotein QseG n=1 Tax=Acerihabitans arboris TaxID=2691583 RepID=A0A845SXY7_9GAMM|nr:two-component system QseEF-associated lipoprotein QseG [Acerihabitans arboris]NDL65725.1 two-component system QseEF-associated lipoprotein QseG [Acerihabitans arboris]
MTLCITPAIDRLAYCLDRLIHFTWPVASLRAALRPVWLLPVLLAGCQGHPAHRDLAHSPAAQVQPASPPNRFAAECNELWQTDDETSLAAPDYWLRAMQCAERITPTQARAQAEQQSGETWHDAFRQSILLNSAGISVIERRQSYQHLLGFRSQFPAAVYPLFKMWRQQQALRLLLADERSRSQRQQESSASQIDLMRIQQIELQRKLDVTTRKLQNLTEIEQRLSARKQQSPDMPDNDDNDTASSPGGGAAGHVSTGQQQGTGK